ncbi:hypothetical protein NL676_035517 [Syzygium grande]|nr:hypothetical protein NL676_035517 [Syzygium grande]
MLIKTVAYAVPTSSMSRFEFLEKWSEQVDAAGSKFWWGQQKSEGTAQWRSWGSSTEAKLEGGLGFRSLSQFNLALLPDLAWRIQTNPSEF